MDLEQDMSLSISRVQCCDCECACSTMSLSKSGAWLRKFQEVEVEKAGFEMPVLDVVKVELEDECVMLRDMVTSQQQRIDNILVELEEERNASASSANEAMSMILRLQREKAEVQMEFRQYKCLAEEKIVHDAEEILALEDLLYKREKVIESLTCEMGTYEHRMMSYGLMEVEAEGEKAVMSQNNGNDDCEAQHDIAAYNYPSVKCNSFENQSPHEVNTDVVEVEKHVFGRLPQSQDRLKNLEYRINQLEESPTQGHSNVELFGTKNVLEEVIVGHSPRHYRHVRKFSNESSSSIFATIKDISPDVSSDDLGSAKMKECLHIHLDENSNLKKFDTGSDVGDDTSNRVHTADYVQYGAPCNSVTKPMTSLGVCEDYMTTQKEPLNMGDLGDPDIKKLYMRLQALEADREYMRQALISLGTEKVQLVILKEKAQRLCLDMSLAKTLPVKKTSVSRSFSIFSFFKWIVSFVFRRKKARQCRYMFGMSARELGLLALLDKGPR